MDSDSHSRDDRSLPKRHNGSNSERDGASSDGDDEEDDSGEASSIPLGQRPAVAGLSATFQTPPLTKKKSSKKGRKDTADASTYQSAGGEKGAKKQRISSLYDSAPSEAPLAFDMNAYVKGKADANAQKSIVTAARDTERAEAKVLAASVLAGNAARDIQVSQLFATLNSPCASEAVRARAETKLVEMGMI